MVNDQNRVPGRGIDKHPYADQKGGVEIFSKTATVLAAQAPIGGVCETMEGDKRFQAGDWILTDNPPTRAWPVNDQVFRATYHRVSDPPTGSIPAVPASSIEEKAVATTKVAKTQRRASRRRATTTKVRNGPPMATPRSKTPPDVPGVEMKPKPGQTTADSGSLGALGGGEPPA